MNMPLLDGHLPVGQPAQDRDEFSVLGAPRSRIQALLQSHQVCQGFLESLVEDRLAVGIEGPANLSQMGHLQKNDKHIELIKLNPLQRIILKISNYC